jgi:hypothetical protein
MRKRTAKKLLLPLIAIGMMTLLSAWDARNRPHAAGTIRPSAAARTAPDLRQR